MKGWSPYDLDLRSLERQGYRLVDGKGEGACSLKVHESYLSGMPRLTGF
jgi:hypothetical protein